MAWIPIAVWIAAAVVAVAVLGYCAYQLRWRAKRLQTDLAELSSLQGDLVILQQHIVATRERLAATGLR